MLNRILLAGLLALTSTLAGCARTYDPGMPEPHTAADQELEADTDIIISEDEVREFLAFEVEGRRADEEADLLLEEVVDETTPGAEPFNQADFDLPVMMNERVEFWMDYFLDRSRERFGIYLTRMGRYEEMIRSELRARGMPEDLIYLALIESGFSPTATSTAAAVGVWQFIASTATDYQLEVSRYVDDRRDPVRATSAALDYLQVLYDRFGSWYLAAAGYNTGENRVERILRERAGGARGDDALFWEISPYLPSETRNYVPKLIAAAILGKYRDFYEFNDITPEAPTPFEVVTVPDATELGVIARAAGVEQEVVEALNPHYLRGVTPPGREAEVRIPVGRSEEFQIAYAKIPPHERVTRIEHLVRRGETLSHIAQRYGTTVRAIQETNGITNPNSLRAGRTIIVAFGRGAGNRAGTVVASTGGARADAQAIATRSGEGEAQGAAAGQTGGQSKAVLSASTATTTYRVRQGDSLWGIARRHGTTVQELRSLNGLGGSSRILPGQELKIGGERSAESESVIVYRIQPGDTIWEIARRHGVTVDNLLRWNSIAADATIRPGEELRVPVIR